MDADQIKPTWSLPYTTEKRTDPGSGKLPTIVRIAVYVALAAALVAPAVQFQKITARNLRRAESFDRQHPDWTPSAARAGGPKRPKQHKGAIGRWRLAVRRFWAGQNIYKPLALDKEDPDVFYEKKSSTTRLHPNMPLTVILLTPFAYMPVWAMALTWNILKVFVLIASILMAASLANHDGRRMPDWVVALGLAWTIPLVIGDIQHGNTNSFVLGAIVFHLWLYRRGHDIAAGVPLAVAICLKMTPALFVLYWLYQRNWKLLGGVLAGMVLLAVVLPAGLVGPERYVELTGTWLENLIIPGLVEGAWYPIHINQSIPGMVSRLFLDGPNGNIYWNPDDRPYWLEDQFGWITIRAVSPATAKMIVRICQAVVVAFMAWAIGLRKLPRDDGRRALHYGMVLLAMMLLNQRTWDHHAAVLIPAGVAIWYAIAFGRLGRKAKAWAVGLVLAAGPLVWLHSTDTYKLIALMMGKGRKVGGDWADIAEAYGPTFFCFVLLFAASVVLAVGIKKAKTPYADRQQKLFG